MSKSSHHASSVLFLTDPTDVVSKKLRSAVTDSVAGVSYDPVERPGVSNLVAIHSGYSGETPDAIASRFSGSRGIVEFKEELIDVVESALRPFREEFARIRNDPGWVREMELEGAERAKAIAEETMKQVRNAVGTE